MPLSRKTARSYPRGSQLVQDACWLCGSIAYLFGAVLERSRLRRNDAGACVAAHVNLLCLVAPTEKNFPAGIGVVAQKMIREIAERRLYPRSKTTSFTRIDFALAGGMARSSGIYNSGCIGERSSSCKRRPNQCLERRRRRFRRSAVLDRRAGDEQPRDHSPVACPTIPA